MNLVEENIYEVSDLTSLELMRNRLFSDPDFKVQDKKGHQMYSSGLNNYCSFARGDGFTDIHDKIMKFDVPVEIQNDKSIIDTPTEPRIASNTLVSTVRRSSIIRDQAIKLAEYKCEINKGHLTFLAERDHMPYMEGHHLIPMKWQSSFSNSIDTYANTICLCPICHRQIHHGETQDRIDMAKHIFKTREDRLRETGIVVKEPELIDMIITL